MNVLPWLLNWPPSRGAVAAFLLLTAFSAGTLVLFGGVTDQMTQENVTVDASDVAVRLNDEQSYPDTGDGVQTCLASGTPGDSVSVQGDVVLDVPAEMDDERLTVVVSLAHTAETTTDTVEGSGREYADVFWVFEDDETLAAGENATLEVTVSTDSETVARATRSVRVEADSRTYDCEE